MDPNDQCDDEDIELPSLGATAEDIRDILDDMPPLDEPDEGAEIW